MMTSSVSPSPSGTLADQFARRLVSIGGSATPDPLRSANAALDVLRETARAEGVALIVGVSGRWTVESARGRGPDPSEPLIAESLDRETVLRTADAWIAPLRWNGASAALLIHQPSIPLDADTVRAIAELLADAHRRWFAESAVHQRAQRLETILAIVADWQQTLETDRLLNRMAEAATRLVNCERASIFLWDRTRHTLIGRPSLGVAGDDLRIPDDRGVVGQVLRKGEPLRINADDDPRAIDRAVDRKLNFHTESLVCVPLQGANGEMFGAFELINKRDGRFSDDDVNLLVELARHASIALANTRNYERLLHARDQLADQAAAGVALVGNHPTIENLRAVIERVADTDLAVLVLGENGTGKEIVSRMIHYQSRRRREPMIAVNCAAIAESLLESELFGHERGAFTDARESHPGKFELAAGGTLLLDEIGDLSLAGQAKLLRVIEDKTVVRVGGTRSIATDARIIASTNRELGALVAEKRFREDLFFRLNVVSLQLPALRDRGDDCLLLADHFLDEFSRRANRTPPRLTPAARRRLLEHRWPGNVRELRNLMERLAYLHGSDPIDARDLVPLGASLPSSAAPPRRDEDQTLADATAAFQIAFIERRIEQAGGNISAAAKQMGLHRANLYRKMGQLGMRGADEP